ncbi:hypothetical protein M1446_00305 [Candidatus Dependentiae bacterium]|nr:hypothetical protein [Candidatus Dependentiae bacterium]
MKKLLLSLLLIFGFQQYTICADMTSVGTSITNKMLGYVPGAIIGCGLILVGFETWYQHVITSGKLPFSVINYEESKDCQRIGAKLAILGGLLLVLAHKYLDIKQ